MRAVLLIGHGSLRPGSGAAMIRLAARARQAGVAPIVEAGFLNYSRPRFPQALARCVAQGAAEVVVQPYFLIPGKFVQVDLPRALKAFQAAHPALVLRLAAPFGDHPAMAELVLKRAAATADGPHPSLALYPEGTRLRQEKGGFISLALSSQFTATHPPPLPSQWDRGSGGEDQAALLLMAHGSPNPSANQPIEQVAARIRATGRYAQVVVCYMDLNQPSICEAIDDLVVRGARRLVAVPYFLQLGGHVAEDLPATIEAARQRHAGTEILLAEHLGYDALLVEVIAERVIEHGIKL
jgi:sirohydrochlorin cobaltochelatase